MHDLLLTCAGLVILVLAGDMLVRGAVNVSLRLGVPALIVSLTIVAVGTSAPEMLVSVSAVLEHAPGIAVGNVVGSNIANVLLVLGLPAMLAGMGAAGDGSRGSYVQMMLATLFFLGIAWLGPLRWPHGLALLALYAAFMWLAIRKARAHRRAEAAAALQLQGEIEGIEPGAPWLRILFYLALGLVGLPLGADMLVEGATGIARAHHVSETVIGLTLVAVGTSLPELATTLAAALRRQADVAIGNVLGSNIANLLGILGVASFFGAVPVYGEVRAPDILTMLGASAILAPFVLLGLTLSRLWGALFMALYLIYVAVVIF